MCILPYPDVMDFAVSQFQNCMYPQVLCLCWLKVGACALLFQMIGLVFLFSCLLYASFVEFGIATQPVHPKILSFLLIRQAG